MLEPMSELVTLAIAATLLLLALRQWITVVRAELPPWRNALCCVALSLLFLVLIGAAFEFLLPFARRGSSETLIFADIELFHPLCLIAVTAAAALKRLSRIQATLAGFLMFVVLPLGYR